MADSEKYGGASGLGNDVRRSQLRFPRSRRELLQLLALYDPATGLTPLLSRLDCREIGPIDVYRTVHQRAPDSVELAVRTVDYDARQHLKEAILSAEFRQQSIAKFLCAFPELRRDVFIHIPNCPGADLILDLAQRHLSMPTALDHESSVSADDWLNYISGIAQCTPHWDTVFISGHFQLGEYIDTCGIRHGDRVFTIIRDPVEVIVSQVNRAVNQLRLDPDGVHAETQKILGYLELQRAPQSLSAREGKALAVRLLLDARVVRPNLICTHLGKDTTPSYAVAMNLVVTNDIEIATASTYARWTNEKWAIKRPTGRNRDHRYLTCHEVAQDFASQIEALSGEDQQLYQLIQRAIERQGSASIHGSALPKLYDAMLLMESPDILIEKMQPVRTLPDILVAEGSDSVRSYLERLPADADGSIPAAHTRINFGATGLAESAQKRGWGEPEREYTWTVGPQSEMALPRPKIRGKYSLRTLVKPFVSEPNLPFQRVELFVNGVVVGGAQVCDVAVLECGIEWDLICQASSINLAFSLPDATRPSDIQHASDSRELGLAFEWLEISAYKTKGSNFPSSSSPATSSLESDAERSYAELMTHFESLGENCEFGLVQRRCGAEPLGLLRFSSSPLRKLLKALDNNFEGMGTTGSMDVQVSSNGKEFMVKDLQFGFLYHAWVLVGDMTPEAILEREYRRVPFLIRKLKEDLAEGHKIFVFHGMEALSGEDASLLHKAIRRYGDNTLMWVEVADDTHAAGTVEWTGSGLLKSYVDRFAPGDNAHDLSIHSWLSVCERAYSMCSSMTSKDSFNVATQY